MSTATMTAREQAQSERNQANRDLTQRVRDFTMPEINVGDEVFWYKKADISQRPHLCTVKEKYIGNVALRDGELMVHLPNVRHVDDPKLVQSPELLMYGAWDYTDSDKAKRNAKDETSRRFAAMEARIAKLEERLGRSNG